MPVCLLARVSFTYLHNTIYTPNEIPGYAPDQRFCNCVTLTFDLLASGSMHAEILPYSICTGLPNLVAIAEVVFFFF